MGKKAVSIRHTDAWGMYEAQMRDLGAEVRFGQQLDGWAAKVETRLQQEWEEEHGR